MEKLALNALKRTLEGRIKDLRADKKIPAVVYGHNYAPVTVSLDYSEFLKTFRISGKTHIIKLSIDGKPQDVIVHALQFHPVSGDFLHVDFMVINAKEKLHVKIPLKLIGNAPATREWGMVDQLISEIDVKCFPADLVDHFEFDISNMSELGQVAQLSEMNIDPKKYDVQIAIDTPIVSIFEQRGVVIEEEAVAPADVPATKETKKDSE